MTRATAAGQRSPLPPAELLVPPERPRFFTGRLLTAEDLSREQEYHIRKRRLHNLATLGAGIVAGLSVSEDSSGTGVVVSPGYAIDPLGREVIVPQPARLSRPTLISNAPRRWFVVLRYAEEEASPAPAPGRSETGVENTIIRETYALSIEAKAPAPEDPSLVLRMLTPATKRRKRRPTE